MLLLDSCITGGHNSSDRIWRHVMTDTIVVIAAGEMGAGIGKRLTERGARVLTSLKGRGGGSAARAKQAGMIDVDNDDALVAEADFVLSVVPPGQAAVARKGGAQADLCRLQCRGAEDG